MYSQKYVYINFLQLANFHNFVLVVLQLHWTMLKHAYCYNAQIIIIVTTRDMLSLMLYTRTYITRTSLLHGQLSSLTVPQLHACRP